MTEWLSTCGARLVWTTTLIDRGYRLFDRARSIVVLALASDATLARYNELAYGATDRYRPDSPAFRTDLFPWEEQAIERHFPPPPARVLIGGAGGGREAFALAAKGYEVVAFDPSRPLIERAAVHLTEGGHVGFYRAGYEDLPLLMPARPGAPACRLNEMGSFDGAIIGWSSFSHIRSEEQRLRTLRAFAQVVTDGPILVSFFTRPDGDAKPARLGRLRHRLPGRLSRDPANAFAPFIGYYRMFTRSEIEALAREAGLEIVQASVPGEVGSWPHAIFVSQRTGSPGPSSERAATRAPLSGVEATNR